MAVSSSGESPGFSSTAMPRSRKIAAALGSILSAMRTLMWSVIACFLCPSPLLRGREGAAFRRRKGEGEIGDRSSAPLPARACARVDPLPLKGRGFSRFPRPVEPRAERFDVGGVDRCSAPDAQAWGGIAISADVVGGAIGFEPLHHRFLPRRVALGIRAVGELQADGSVGADRRVRRKMLD